jgi:arginase
LFERSGGSIVGAETIRRSGVSAALGPALEALRSRVSRIYLHFDLDVLDPERAPANEFAAPDGLTAAQVEEAVRMIGERFTVCASGIASYDPLCDKDDEVLGAGVAIMKSVLASVSSRSA